MSQYDFNENYAAEFDSVDSRAVNFDYEEVYSRLDGENQDGADDTLPDGAEQKVITALLDWILKAVLTKGGSAPIETRLRITGVRACAALWVLHPDYFEGTPSAAELSKRLGGCRVMISTYASEFTAKFGVRNGAQKHGRNGKHADKLKSAVGTKCHVEQSATWNKVPRGTGVRHG